MQVTIQKLEPDAVNRMPELLDLFEEAFERVDLNRPPQSYWQALLHQPTVWVFVALTQDQLVGGLTAYVLPTYSCQQPTVYLYDLAVRKAYQRQGVGRQLLATLTQHARHVGASEVFVQADTEDSQAIAFYQAIGGQAQRVVHFTYSIGP